MRLLLTRPWTEQDESLLGLLLSLHTVARVARRLRRSESSVRSKAKELGLKISANSSAIRLQRRSPNRSAASCV